MPDLLEYLINVRNKSNLTRYSKVQKARVTTTLIPKQESSATFPRFTEYLSIHNQSLGGCSIVYPMPTIQTVSFPALAIDEIPPEMLIEICSLNARQIPWPKDHLQENIRRLPSRLPQDILDTIRASHVCRRWRKILISVPRLWKNMVDPYDTEWSNIILERSAPLGVAFVPSRRPREERDLQKEFAMVKRLRERLAEYHIDQLGPIFSALQDVLVFPVLKVFSLCGRGQVPQTFPGEATPALKTLHLSYSNSPSLKSVTAISRTLTKLFVIVPYKKRASGFWGNLMSQLPHLEVIVLKLCLATVDHDWVDNYENFQTNVLEFSVYDFAEHLIAFVPRIQFGQSLARLQAECYVSVTGDTAHLPDLESHLIQSFSDKARRIFQRDTVGTAGIWIFDLHLANQLDYHPLDSPWSMSSLDHDKGIRDRWFMNISCDKRLGLPSFLPPNFLTPQSCSHVDALNVSHFDWPWEYLCPILCNYTNLQIFRATPSFISEFMRRINSNKHAASVFPFLRGIYLDSSDLVVSGYRDMFPSNTSSNDEGEDLESRKYLLTHDWDSESDGSSSIYKFDPSDDSDSDEGDEVEEVVDKDGNHWDDHSFIQELESISVEQIVHFCKARPSIRFVSLLDVPEKEAFVILRERLGEMGVEIRKHDTKCFDMVTK